MPSRADLWPARMCRIGVVAPTDRARRVLVEVAGTGTVETDTIHGAGTGGVLADRTVPTDVTVVPKLSPDPIDPEHLDADEAGELLAGEASLERRLAAATVRGRCTILPGWVRESDVEATRAAVGPFGGAIVELPRRRGLAPPTAYVPHRAGTAFRPLITTYGTVPYVDVDPTLFAAAAYVFMFGMMFGDVAHGLAIALVGVAALFAQQGRLLALRPLAWFLVAAGSAAMVFGFLYGDAFGPTGLVPTLWIRPLDDPEQFLVAGLEIVNGPSSQPVAFEKVD